VPVGADVLGLHRVMPMNVPRSPVARVFRVLGDDTRLTILALLRVRELCVCELTALVGLSQAAVSEHLRRLKDAGLVEDERRGTWAFYHLRADLPDYVRAALAAADLPAEAALRFAEMVPGARCAAPPPAAPAALGRHRAP
jgi:DNA-binding transcriptional ArsR family regulator